MTGQDLSIRIVRSVTYRNDARWNHKINIYPYDTFYFVLGGDGHVQIGETVTDLRRGYVYLIPANTLYSCWCESFIDKLYVEAYVESIPGKSAFPELCSIQELPFPADAIQELVLRNRQETRDRLWFHGEFEKAVSLFIDERHDPPSPEMLRFRRMLDDIAVNLSASIRLADIAAKYGWHPSALSRSFRKAFHCGLKQYVDQLLMSKLRQELLAGEKSLKSLAEEYQFCDAYYLSAFFKKHAGTSPQQYRQQNYRFTES